MLNSIPKAEKAFGDGCMGRLLKANGPIELIPMMPIIGNMPQKMLNVGDNVIFLYSIEVAGQLIGVDCVEGNVFVWISPRRKYVKGLVERLINKTIKIPQSRTELILAP